MRRVLFMFIPTLVLLGIGELVGRIYTSAEEARGPVFPHGYPGPAFVSAGPGWVRARYQDPDLTGPFTEVPTPGVPRVMVFGESSVRGGVRGIRDDQEFPSLLIQRLAPRLGPLEVLNMGKPGIDMAGITAIAHQAAVYQPAIVVLYAGHNDVGNHTLRVLAPGGQRRPTPWWTVSGLFRLVRWGWAVVHPPEPPSLPKLDRGAVATTFRAGLEEFVSMFRSRNVVVMVATPTSNIWHWHAGTPVCPAVSRAAWEVSSAGRWSVRPEVPWETAERMYAEAPDCPEVGFVHGRARYFRGEVAEGVEELRRARDLDPIPFRADATILDVIRGWSGTPFVLVDIEAEWARAGAGVETRFHDIVHFELSGHLAMAESLEGPLEAELRKLPTP